MNERLVRLLSNQFMSFALACKKQFEIVCNSHLSRSLPPMKFFRIFIQGSIQGFFLNYASLPQYFLFIELYIIQFSRYNFRSCCECQNEIISRLWSLSLSLICHISLLASNWWAQMESNHRPHAYQACALTDWAMSPYLDFNKYQRNLTQSVFI